MQELKRVCSKKLALIILGFMLVNMALFYMEQEKKFNEFDGRYEKYGEVSLTETYRQVDLLINDLRGKSSNEVAESIKNRMLEANVRSELGEHSKELAAMFLSNRLVNEELKSVSAFDDRVFEVLLNVEEYRKMETYSDPSTFGYHNVLKTKYDYKKYIDLPVQLSNGKAIEAVMEYRYADYLLLILIMIIVLCLVEEKRNGLNQIVYGTPGGRLRLAGKRCLTLLLVGTLSTILLYGSMLVESFFLYRGIGSLNDLLQCHIYFEGTFYIMSKAMFLLVYLLVHSLCAFAFALFTWVLFSLLRGKNGAVFVFGTVIAMEYLCMELLRENSKVGLYKYFNIFSLVEPSQCMIGYYNFAFLGIAIDKVQILYGLITAIILLCSVTAILSESFQRPAVGAGLLDRCLNKVSETARRVTGTFPVFVMELYKVLFLRKGILVLALLVFLIYSQRYIVGVTYTEIEVQYNKYLESINRETGEGAQEYLTALEAEIAGMEQNKEAARAQGNDVQGLEMMIQQKTELRNCIVNALEQKSQLLEERGIQTYLLQKADYNAVLGSRCQSYQEKFAIFAITILIVLQAGSFSFERQQKVDKLIEGTPGGRKKLFLKKIGASVILTAVVWGITYLPQLQSLREAFNLSDWEAPIQSLDSFTEFPMQISIRGWMLWILAYRLLLLEAVMLIVSLISMVTSYQSSLLFSILLFVPHFLSMLGITLLEAVSIVRPMEYNENFVTYGFGIQGYIAGIGWMAAGTVAFVVAYRKVTGRGFLNSGWMQKTMQKARIRWGER